MVDMEDSRWTSCIISSATGTPTSLIFELAIKPVGSHAVLVLERVRPTSLGIGETHPLLVGSIAPSLAATLIDLITNTGLSNPLLRVFSHALPAVRLLAVSSRMTRVVGEGIEWLELKASPALKKDLFLSH